MLYARISLNTYIPQIEARAAAEKSIIYATIFLTSGKWLGLNVKTRVGNKYYFFCFFLLGLAISEMSFLS